MIATALGPSSPQVAGDVVAAFLVLWVMWRQLRPQPLRMRRMLLLPVLLVFVTVLGFKPAWWHLPDVLLVTGITTAFALVAGFLRGWLNRPDRRPDGTIWVTGGPLAVAVYGLTLAVHFGLDQVMGTNQGALLAVSAPVYLAALLIGRLGGLWFALRREGLSLPRTL
jgi:protein-S-isoprenylcysteine O-methyltransferase Ste14